jgi:hypothetical protein
MTELKNDLPKLAKPAQRALANAGIGSLKQMSRFTRQQISELHGIGNNALVVLQKALEDAGLSFKTEKKNS